MADLNDILFAYEASPRPRNAIAQHQLFSDRLDEYALHTLNSLGSPFTWVRYRNNEIVLRRRLDRAVAILNYQARFSASKLIHLARIHSDHHPLLLVQDPEEVTQRELRPRRFLAAWLTREDFNAVFQTAWSSPSDGIARAITKARKDCFLWGENSFGDIFKRKRILLRRIEGIQCLPPYRLPTTLSILERDLIVQYNKVLQEEELLWYQKLRVQWISSGERKNSFYPTSVLIRRNPNKISALRINVESNFQPELLKQHVLSYW